MRYIAFRIFKFQKRREYHEEQYTFLEKRTSRDMRKGNLGEWKAVVLDLDETLLHSDGSVSEYTLEILRECKKRGL